MLDNDYPSESVGRMERCEPDYEGLISASKRDLEKNIHLQDAIFSYIGYRRLKGNMAELVGELVSRQRVLNYKITNYIKDQEESEKEAKK